MQMCDPYDTIDINYDRRSKSWFMLRSMTVLRDSSEKGGQERVFQGLEPSVLAVTVFRDEQISIKPQS